MRENFITIINFDYLPQALNLYSSLKNNFENFTLWIVCMDKKVESFLKEKKYLNIIIIPLKKIENQKLLKVKKDRSLVEYCWTLTPFLPSYLFKKYKKIKRVTYLDADIFFFKSPKRIINEFSRSRKSIFLTEHGFDPKEDESKISGRFCVQYMIFKNNVASKEILKWWQNKCLEWCYAFSENGKLGDQKYLDLWPTLFKKSIHISKFNEYFQAPWNIKRFKAKNIILFHFHGLKINGKKIYILSKYGLNKNILNKIYIPYIQLLKVSLAKIGFDIYQNKENALFLKDIKYQLNNIFYKKKELKRYIYKL